MDCPYLSDLTPTTDRHFAGMISFFGCNPEICGSRRFVVDVSEALRFKLEQGTLSPTSFELQLLPFTGDGSLVGQPLADHGRVTLISG